MKLKGLYILLFLSFWAVGLRAEKGCLSGAKKGVCQSSKVVHGDEEPDGVGNFFESYQKTDRKYEKNGKITKLKDWFYTYDSLGNLIRKSKLNTSDPNWKNGDWSYKWFSSGMLESVRRPDGEIVSFTYDPLGRRLSKTFKKTTTHFLWDANKVLHEWKTFESKDPITDNTITWIFNEYDYSPIAKLKNGKAFSILSDHLGTPTHMYDSEGEEVWSGTLDIYGRKRQESGAEMYQPFRYQGQVEDEETGLYYNRFRYYSSEEGQYISKDPVELAGDNPTMYGYVANNNFWFDPFGLSCTKKLRKNINAAQRALKKNGVMKRAWRKEKGSAAHHIVAGDDLRAKPARDILEKHGIDVDGAENGIYLRHIDKNSKQPGAYHREIHTDKYYNDVNSRIQRADRLGGKDAVLKEMNKIQDELLFDTKVY